MFKRKPDNWEDSSDWNQYYASLGESIWDELFASYRTDILDAQSAFFAQLENKQNLKIWFPGCGLSLMPRLFAALGFQVWASDYSEEAIQQQTALYEKIPEVKTVIEQSVYLLLGKHATGTLVAQPHFVHHDFRTPFPSVQFDYIVNMKAYFRFKLDSMKWAARVHHASLIDGGTALFIGSDSYPAPYWCEVIESKLVEAGFLLPTFQTDQWARQNLNHLDERLQYPAVRKLQSQNEYADGVIDEYLERRQLEFTASVQKAKDHPQLKIAYVLYHEAFHPIRLFN